jgi:hypothetical protein
MPTGSSEHAEGLMLLRASTLKIIRLQLAMERHDRRLAIEAMDDLVALDRRLQDYLAAVPATGEQLMFQRELDCERAALNAEKLTLAAEVLRRPTNAANPNEADPIAPAEELHQDDDWLGPRNLQFEPAEPARRSRWWLALPILALGLAAGAYLASVPDAAALLAEIGRALQ